MELDLSLEKSRLQTYPESYEDRKRLARAGFSYTAKGTLDCFGCHAQDEASHTEECIFLLVGPSRSKKFCSITSLYYEKARIETFIDWPINWLSPRDLAAQGFYYTRIHDHCACVFCNGIVGAWEVGDIPRQEHLRHFPNCRFMNGLPVGNVPLAQCIILEGLCLEGEEPPMIPPRNFLIGAPPAEGSLSWSWSNLNTGNSSFLGGTNTDFSSF